MTTLWLVYTATGRCYIKYHALLTLPKFIRNYSEIIIAGWVGLGGAGVILRGHSNMAKTWMEYMCVSIFGQHLEKNNKYVISTKTKQKSFIYKCIYIYAY